MWPANTKVFLTKFVILLKIMFHNLKWYEGLPMMLDISNFDRKINVMLSGTEEYMPFMSG